MKQNKKNAVIWTMVLVALCLRLFYRSFRGCIQTDSVQYLNMAHNLFQAGGWKDLFTGRSSGYSLPIAIFNLFGIELEMAGYLVSILAGSLIIWPITQLARDWYGWKTAVWVSILVAIHPFLVEASLDVLPTALYSLTIITAIYYGWKALESGKRRDYILTAMLWGYTYLIRVEGIVYPLVWFIFYFCFRHERKEQGRVREGRNFVLALLLLGLFVFSYIGAHRYTTGHWSLGGLIKKASLNIFIAKLYPPPEERKLLEGDIKAYGFSGNLWAKREIALTNYIRRLNMEWLSIMPQIIPLPMIGLAFLGLFSRPWDRHRRRREVYLFVMLYPLLLYPLSRVIVRYLLPTSFIILLWVSNGIVEMGEWARRTGMRYAKFVLFVVGGVACFLLAVQLIQPIRENPYYRYWREHKEVGLWMAENLPPGQDIMSRKPYVAFYARGNHTQLPDQEIEEILEMARTKGIDYLVIDERSMGSYKSVTLKSSLKCGEAFGLKEVYRLNPEKGYSIVLYKVGDK